jgi:hypothetical protein
VERHVFVDPHLSGFAVDFEPQKSKTKPYPAELLISSASLGAVTLGGVQNTVSRKAPAFSSGSEPGDQWLAAAARAKPIPFSGFAAAKMRPSANRTSYGRKFNCAAAIRATLSLRREAARWAAPATALANRLE